MKTVTVQLFELNELNQDAKLKAIEAHQEFLNSTEIEAEDEDGNPEFYYHNHTEQEAIESIEINEYLFYENGSLAHCVTYTGGHEKAGTTELILKHNHFKLN